MGKFVIQKDNYNWHPALEPYRECNRDPVAFDNLATHCTNLGNTPNRVYVWISDSGENQVLSSPNEADAYFLGYPWGQLDADVITNPSEAVGILLKSTETWDNRTAIHNSGFHLQLKNWLKSVSPVKPKVTDAALSKLLGISRSTLTNSLRLQKLAPEVQDYIAIGAIGITQAKTMTSLPHTEQRRLARMSVQRDWSTRALSAVVSPANKNGKPGTGKNTSPDIVRFNRVISERSGLDVSFEALGEDLTKGTLRVNFGTIGELQRVLGLVTGGAESEIQKGMIVLDIEKLSQIESFFSKLMK
jgi:hypothetical protein